MFYRALLLAHVRKQIFQRFIADLRQSEVIFGSEVILGSEGIVAHHAILDTATLWLQLVPDDRTPPCLWRLRHCLLPGARRPPLAGPGSVVFDLPSRAASTVMTPALPRLWPDARALRLAVGAFAGDQHPSPVGGTPGHAAADHDAMLDPMLQKVRSPGAGISPPWSSIR